MKTIYNRTLALIMAVVLCFSMVPMAAFATEAEPSESEASSALEEPAEEELPPEDDTSSIVEEILPEDIPVVYARDPITKVKADLEGGSSYLTNYGVTRAAIVNELESHRNDSYYLGTPYAGGDVQSPNGDTSYNGSAGMNCGGFVGYVLRKVGLNCSAAIELMKSTGDDLWFGSGKPYDLLAGASNYYQLAKAAGLTCYVYNTKAEMLADGKCEKGDIILMYWSLQPFSDGADNHIGFFWGESSGDDVLWHSSTEPGSGNQISAITPKAANAIYILIKIEPTGYNVTLTKTSADASYTQGNNSYSLAGATYAVYTTSDATGTPVATFTTDENGHAELAKPLGNGTYTVKETKAPKGYKLDENIYTFHINGSDTSVDVQDDPGRVRLKLVKRDPKTGEIAQGNASLAGAVYQITYQKGGQTVTLEGTSDAQGHIEPVFKDIPFGKVTVQEIKAPEGYKLDTTPHTYDIGAPDVVTDVYEMEPTDITDEVVRGGVTIEKRDSVTGDKPQGDASFAGIKFDIINKSTNAVEVNGKNCAPGSVVMTITTDNNGMATTGPNTLPYGDYLIRESATNNSMLHTFTEEIPVTVDEDGKIYPFTAENDVVRGGISIEKRDSQTGQTPQGNADFSGITFEIVNRSANPVVVDGLDYAPGAVVATMTTDIEGKASTADDALPFGRYEVRESATNESMLLTFKSQMVTVSENKKVYPVVAENDVVRGGLSLEKHDSITGATPQGDAGFEGITFQIINKSRNPVIVNGNSYAPDEVVLELVTDAEGKASTANDALPFGEYLLHESATNESMLNTAPDQQVVISEHHKVYPFVAENEVVRGGVLIEKRDLESGLLTPLGGASLDGTLFEITNKSKNAVYVDGALYDPDTVCLTIEVKDGIAQSDVRALPYGTYSMVESKPGTGYLWTDKKVRDFTVRSDGEVTEYREGNAAYNQVKRGDLRFVKVGEDTMHRFGNVAFKLTSQTTGESHILVTDANGEVRTETAWNPHTQNTNGNDDTEDWDDLTGIWFGQTTEGWIVETQDGLCALPYDHYRLEELRCPGNEGYELVTVPNIFISRDSTVIELGTIDDKFEGVPEIGTTATINGEKTADPLEEVTLVDTVEYSGLTAGKTYTISGILMDKSTGEPLEIDGQQVTAEKEFTPKSDSGTVDLEYTFNASALAGRAVVVFETLYQDGVEVASHADIDDEGQTVGFRNPKIGTTATVDGEKVADPLGTVTITDTVTYIGLTAGKEYTVKGVLMDKSTGEKLLIDDKEITAEATFTAPKSEGSIDIPFTFDASGLAGKSVVVFESLYHEGIELAVHADIEDEGQTINFGKPDIKTTATINGEKATDPMGEVTIVDTVEYTGLTVGKTYNIKGVLMDKSTGGKLLVDGKEITSEAEFTAEKEKGTVEVSFTFDCSGLAGKSIVVFETLYQEGLEVVVHADIEDEAQTVFFNRKGGLIIKKTAEDDMVEGISFLVTGHDYAETFTTDAQGQIYIKDLLPGEYKVTELLNEVTAKYVIEEGKVVTVTTGDEAAAVEFHNKLRRGQIVGRKTDTAKNPLTGVVFGLFPADATEFAEKDAIATAQTSHDGSFIFANVPYGSYQVVELESLPGYILLKEPVPVEVDADEVRLSDIINEQGKISITKVDADTNKPLAGAKLQVLDKNGKVLESWTSEDKAHLMEMLPVGEYVLHEEEAPTGYSKAEDIQFTVDEDTTALELVMKDKPTGTKTTVPNTGDFGWVIALAVLAISLGGAGLAVFLGRKK